MSSQRSDDPFRDAGSSYVDDEVVCVGVCVTDSVVDWWGREPIASRWIPETLYGQLAGKSNVLAALDIYRQNRLGVETAVRLAEELSQIAGQDAGKDVAQAIELIIPLVLSVANSAGKLQLLIEGP